MSDPVWKWQSAVYNLAKNDATLAALVGGRIYRRPPPSNAALPYVYFGDVELAPEPLYSEVAEKMTMTTYIVSNAPDLNEIMTIMQATRDAIDGKNVNVPGYYIMGVHYAGRKSGRTTPSERVGEISWRGLLDPKND